MSADTIVAGYANPQNLNRYSYVTNNPLRYTDPTGHLRIENQYGGGCSTSGFCGGSTSAGSGGGSNAGGNSNDDDEDETTNSGAVPASSAMTPTQTANGLPTSSPAPGGANNYDCFTHPEACGTGTPPITTSTINYEQIAEGTLLLVSLFLLVDIPIGIGFVELFPEMEIGMVLTEAWTYPLALVIVDAHIHGVNLIYEGFTAEEKIINPIIDIH